MKSFFEHIGKRLGYTILVVIAVAILVVVSGFIKNSFFNKGLEAAETLAGSIEDGAAFTMNFDYYSLGEKTGDYTKIDFDGTTYSVEDMASGDVANITCEKESEECEDVEDMVQEELDFIKLTFDKTYDQKITSDDEYSYSEGETESGQPYKEKVSNDGKTAVDEFNTNRLSGNIVTITVK